MASAAATALVCVIPSDCGAPVLYSVKLSNLSDRARALIISKFVNMQHDCLEEEEIPVWEELSRMTFGNDCTATPTVAAVRHSSNLIPAPAEGMLYYLVHMTIDSL